MIQPTIKPTPPQSQPQAKTSHIDAIVIHCSADPEGRDRKMEDIKQYHKSIGYDDIGYNYIIELDGTVKEGRSLEVDGAHCKLSGSSGKSYNKHSIGICYIGGLSKDMKKAKDTRTDAQKAAMHELVERLCQQYEIKEILGHRDASVDKDGDGVIESFEYAKQCPSFNVKPEFSKYV